MGLDLGFDEAAREEICVVPNQAVKCLALLQECKDIMVAVVFHSYYVPEEC